VTEQISDEALIETIARGDRLAMQVLFARHNRRIFRFVLRLVRDTALAEDVVGEVFLDVWCNAANHFQARSTVSTWLLSIARYKALDFIKRQTTVSAEGIDFSFIEDTALGPEQHLLYTESLLNSSKDIRKLIDVLSINDPECAKIVKYMLESEQSDPRIISEALKIPVKAVYNARKRLKRHSKELLGSTIPECPFSGRALM
jgi:RNA polymerase sigma-70 factor (ECF subfamily)